MYNIFRCEKFTNCDIVWIALNRSWLIFFKAFTYRISYVLLLKKMLKFGKAKTINLCNNKYLQHNLPFMSIATSMPFLVLLWAHFANMWGIYFIATNGPKYTLEVLGFNMKSVSAFGIKSIRIYYITFNHYYELLLMILYVSSTLNSIEIVNVNNKKTYWCV